jgi:hypothetical protein
MSIGGWTAPFPRPLLAQSDLSRCLQVAINLHQSVHAGDQHAQTTKVAPRPKEATSRTRRDWSQRSLAKRLRPTASSRKRGSAYRRRPIEKEANHRTRESRRARRARQCSSEHTAEEPAQQALMICLLPPLLRRRWRLGHGRLRDGWCSCPAREERCRTAAATGACRRRPS